MIRMYYCARCDKLLSDYLNNRINYKGDEFCSVECLLMSVKKELDNINYNEATISQYLRLQNLLNFKSNALEVSTSIREEYDRTLRENAELKEKLKVLERNYGNKVLELEDENGILKNQLANSDALYNINTVNSYKDKFIELQNLLNIDNDRIYFNKIKQSIENLKRS